jgi:hypothetical protein
MTHLEFEISVSLVTPMLMLIYMIGFGQALREMVESEEEANRSRLNREIEI